MSEKTASQTKGTPRINRREILGLSIFVSMATLFGKIIDLGIKFSRPRIVPGEFGGLIPAGNLGDLPAIGDAPINFPEGRFYLIQTEAGLVALHKVCTHLDCLFNWDDQIGNFVCPCHGSRFDRDGTVLSGPAIRSLDRFVIQMIDPEGNMVAETDEETGTALAVPVLAKVEGTEKNESTDGSGNPSEQDSAGILDKGSSELSPEGFSFLVDTSRKIEGKIPGKE